MANRRLSQAESKKANALLDKIRARLQALSAGDPQLLFAYRRRIHIRLMQDERGRPALRRKLKREKWKQQPGQYACSLTAPKTRASYP
jgi:hypothetical protein